MGRRRRGAGCSGRAGCSRSSPAKKAERRRRDRSMSTRHSPPRTARSLGSTAAEPKCRTAEHAGADCAGSYGQGHAACEFAALPRNAAASRRWAVASRSASSAPGASLRSAAASPIAVAYVQPLGSAEPRPAAELLASAQLAASERVTSSPAPPRRRHRGTCGYVRRARLPRSRREVHPRAGRASRPLGRGLVGGGRRASPLVSAHPPPALRRSP
jgi:hypothetical protein